MCEINLYDSVANNKSVYWHFRKRLYGIKLRFFEFFGTQIIHSAYGVKLKANYSDMTFRGYVKATDGGFYWEHLSRIKTPFIYLDIGANQGLYSICAGINPSCIGVVSFEPVKSTFKFLKDNLEINRLLEKSRILNVAVSSASGLEDVFVSSVHSGGAALASSKKDSEIDAVVEKVKLMGPDEINEVIGDKNTDIVVKIDVEGHESVVFETLRKAEFFYRIKQFFIEIDEDWTDPKDLVEKLRIEGFSTLIKVGKGTHYDLLATRP